MSPAKRAKGKTPKKMGRPSAYKPEYVAMAAKACSLGATDHDLAELFGVSDATIDNWKVAHPDFLGSLKDAKAELDAKVERSLYERATGYSHSAVKIFANAGETFEHEYTEKYPPDTTAQIFWLKNRQPQRWRDKQEIEHSASESLAAIIARTPRK